MNGNSKIDQQEPDMGEPLLDIDQPALAPFVFLWVDGKRWAPREPFQHHIILTDKQLGVVLTVPVRLAAAEKPRNAALAFYYKTCLVRTICAKDRSVRIVGAGAIDVTIRPPVKADRIKREPRAPTNPA